MRVLFCISHCLLLYCIDYSFNVIAVFLQMSFGCCDGEISPFAGQIKEILILMLTLVQWFPTGGARDRRGGAQLCLL